MKKIRRTEVNASGHRRWPIIGVVYLQASLGYRGFPGMREYEQDALEQIHILMECGVDGILLENENDRPYTLSANLEVVACMSAVCSRVRVCYPDLYLGVEFLLNDPAASFAIAVAAQADFIRTDYWVDRMSRAEYGGEMAINPQAINQFRDKISAGMIEVYADIQVKYAQMLTPRVLIESAGEAFRQRAQSVVVSGSQTGEAVECGQLKNLFLQNPAGPIFLGSGLNTENFQSLLPWCEGAMVGSALMREGRIDRQRAQEFFRQMHQFRMNNESRLPRRRWH